MKHYQILLALSLILTLSSTNAQSDDSIQFKKPNEWIGLKIGVYGGPVYANMRSHDQFTVGDFVWRSNFGTSFQLDLSRVFAFEFDLDIISKGYSLSDSIYDFLGNFVAPRYIITHETYLSFPVLLKLNIRKKTGFYLLGGGHFSLQMSSKKSVDLLYSSGTQNITEIGFQQHPIDLGAIYGLGFEVPVKQYQLGFEVRHNFGFLPVSAEVGYSFQNHQSLSFLMAFKYKKPQPKKIFKGVSDL